MSRKRPPRMLLAGYVVLVFWTVFCLFPLSTMVLIALKPRRAFLAFPPQYFALKLTLHNVIMVMKDVSWLKYYGNTIGIALAAACIAVLVGSLAAYAFARYAFTLKGFFLVFILALQMIPGTSIIIPLYTMFADINLLDTYSVLILLNAAGAMPLVIWLMKGYFGTIPKDLEDAALLDGCSPLQAFVNIVFPLSAPGLAAATIYAFVRAFNDYLLARTLAGSRVITYTVGLTTFTNQYEGMDLTRVAAASFIALLPMIIMFAGFHKYFVIGLTGGALKE